MNRLTKLIGRWRLFWNLCPECNSDAPEVDSCPVCHGWDRAMWPPSEFVKAQWWNRFITTDHQTAGDNFGCLVIKEPFLKRSWRWILKAHHRHAEVSEPSLYLLLPEREKQKWEGWTEEDSKFSAVYAKDAITTEVTVVFGTWDRIRIFLGCDLKVKLTTYCQTPPGIVKTEPALVFPIFD